MHNSTIIGGWLLAACLFIGLSTARAEEPTQPKPATSELERFNDTVVEMGGKKPEGALCKYTSECESRPGMRCSRPRGAPLKVPTRCMLKGY
jgi:hypothetical protein